MDGYCYLLLSPTAPVHPVSIDTAWSRIARSLQLTSDRHSPLSSQPSGWHATVVVPAGPYIRTSSLGVEMAMAVMFPGEVNQIIESSFPQRGRREKPIDRPLIRGVDKRYIVRSYERGVQDREKPITNVRNITVTACRTVGISLSGGPRYRRLL